MVVACSLAKSIRPLLFATFTIGPGAAHTGNRNAEPHLIRSKPHDELSLLGASGCRVSQRLLSIDQSAFHKFIDFFD